MTDDFHSDEECRFLFTACRWQPKYTCTVCKFNRRLVWTRSWTPDMPRVEGWEFIHHCYLSCKQLMCRRTEAGYMNTTAPNINPVNNIQCRHQVKDFIVRPLDVVYNIHSPDQSQRSVGKRKLSRIELALITESCFQKEKTCESFHDTHEIFFQKLLLKENFPVCHDLNQGLTLC